MDCRSVRRPLTCSRHSATRTYWHDHRIVPGVFVVRLITVLAVCALPCAAAAQTCLDAGRPLAGVMVDAVAAELAGYQPLPFQEPVKTNDQGLFTFERLPPGEYVFGVNLTKGRWKPTTGQAMFLPGTPVAKEATIVELKPGDHKDVGALRLSAR
jgi:hypothetical protein